MIHLVKLIIIHKWREKICDGGLDKLWVFFTNGYKCGVLDCVYEIHKV